jgi:hypothetical protein
MWVIESPYAMSFFINGSGYARVLEQPDAIKVYLVRWKGVKVDITQLAKLRWIEKKKTPDLCRILGLARTTVRRRTRTLRKSGISSLNLSLEERLLIEKQITEENAIYGEIYQ